MLTVYKTVVSTLACVGALAIGSAAMAQTYSFETPSTYFVYNPTNYSGATFSAKSGVSAVGAPFFFTAADGVQAAFIQSTFEAVGTLSLAFTGLTAGGSYSASFYLAQRPTYAVDPLLVSFDGIALGTYTASSTDFAQFTTGSFVATGTSGTLTFTGSPTTTGDNDANIDLVSLTRVASVPTSTVPEPASWALFIGGFGLIGSAMRRRRGSAVLA